MLRWSLALALVLGVAACSHPRPHGRTGASASRAETASARRILSAYLDATFRGQHARAYTLLTRADRQRTTRAAYVEEQRNLSAMRTQVEALGKSKHRIGRISERDDRAVARVTLTSGLGSETLRFVLRREDGRWRVDYGASWASGN